MLHYLYYKLYQAALKGSLKDIPEFMAPIYLGCLLGLNLIVIIGFLSKINLIPFLFGTPAQGSYLIAFLMVLAYLYFGKNKRGEIIKRYEVEANSQRVKGNIIVTIYVAISFLSIFAVALFKPGYLPR